MASEKVGVNFLFNTQYYKENLSSVKFSFMRNLSFVILILFCIIESSFSQVKIINATCQKTFGNLGGITMNYFIEFKTKNSTNVKIDSVKGVADKLSVEYSSIKNDNGYYVISFN